MGKYWIYTLVVIVIIGMLLTGAIAQDTVTNGDKLTIVATTTQAADALRVVAGDLVNIVQLMGPGVDPHLYQPTEADVQAMSTADAVLYSGLHLEGQFDTVFEALGQTDIYIHALSEPVYTAGFILEWVPTQATQGTEDPHFWFDPRNWQLAIDGVAEMLTDLDPDNTQVYRANADAYIEQLDLLYEWGLEALSQIPEKQRVLVTSHDAFQYFGDAFGWEVRGLQGISTQDEAGVADIQDIAEFVVEREIPVMFIESSVPPDTIEAVQEAVQARGGEVNIGVRVLFSDAMGEEDTFGGTYIGMLGQNIITILQSYGYPIPEWPEELLPIPPEELLNMQDVEVKEE